MTRIRVADKVKCDLCGCVDDCVEVRDIRSERQEKPEGWGSLWVPAMGIDSIGDICPPCVEIIRGGIIEAIATAKARAR